MPGHAPRSSLYRRIAAFAEDLFDHWSRDDVPRLSASLAYYTILSSAPLLVISIAIAGAAFGEDAAQGKIAEEIGGTVGEPAAQTIQDMVHAAASPAGNTLATIAGIVILLLAASGLFIELQDALNSIWKVTTKPGRTLWNIVRERILSFGVVVATPAAAVDYVANGVAASTPEASTWAMMVLGFAGLGFAGYRKARKAAVAV